jgi:hypothetical protein
MAEIFGTVASVLQLAGAGLKLSTTLYTYSTTAFKADKELKDIADNVSITSSVLDQLAKVLEEDKKARLCTDSALRTTENVAQRYKSVFEDLETALQKPLSKSKDGKLPTTQKLKWPFMEPKIKVAQSNLESVKSTLLLMLNVVSYARNIALEYVEPLMLVFLLEMQHFGPFTESNPTTVRLTMGILGINPSQAMSNSEKSFPV